MENSRTVSLAQLQDAFLSVTAVRHLVREVLGCGCPDEVFDNIVVGRPTIYKEWNGPTAMQLLVGWRLLVAIVRREDLDDPLLDSIGILREGKKLRDTNHFNRFRLVLLGDVEESLLGDLEEEALKMDDRMHVHKVSAQEIVGH